METATSNPRSMLNANRKVVSVILIFATLIVTIRLADIQIFNSDQYKRNATASQWTDEIIPAQRGTIYDANGTVIAESAQTWTLYLIPEEMTDEAFRSQVCKDVADVLSLDYDELMEQTKCEKPKNDDELVVAHKKYVKSQMELKEKELVDCGKTKDEDKNATCLMHRTYKVVETNSKGEETTTTYKYSNVMGLEKDSKRYYPMGTFASSAVGSVNSDGNGVAGIERYYNTLLSGKNGRKTSYGSDLDENTDTLYEATDGVSLKLTIDENIQNTIDENLQELYETSGGLGAYAVMMDVKTGAILGMDSVGYKGGYDLSDTSKLNSYYQNKLDKAVNNDDFSLLEGYLKDKDGGEQELADIMNEEDFQKRLELHSKKLSYYFMLEQWNNYIYSETYHPGSVFKIFLTAAAIEENIVDDNYTYCCNGSVQVDDRTFNCHVLTGHGVQDLRKGLMNSCNPFFVTLGLKLGAEKFFEYFKAFGFTEKTGIESYEESNSIYYGVDDLTRVTLASSSFGQTFSITPIQLVTALSAIANGGKLMVPYLVDEEIDSDGNVIKQTEPTVKRQVISQSTATKVASMMEDVCKDGTGRNGYVAGYRVAGKTGTTQKYQVKGTYIASFACFAPADDPEIALLVIVDEPQSEINGSTVCAPSAAKIVESTLEYLGVERQYTDEEIANLDTSTPGVIGQNTDSAVESLEASGFTVRAIGTGSTVISQSPASGQTIPQGGVIALYTTDDESERLEVTVPDLTGLSVSAVKKYAASEGLNVRIAGNSTSGEVSYEQSLEAGSKAEYGAIVTIHFKSYENIGDSTGE